MPSRKSVDEKLSALDAAAAAEDRSAYCARLSAALADRHYSVVAKAARLCADGLLYDLQPALSSAYSRFLEKPAKTDPNCLAKKAIARALLELDCNDVDFFLAGLRYRQPEPVWGGTADSAIDVRCSCAMGLVATGYPRALVVLTELLHDAEGVARAGAARAIACGNPREAELLLRCKVLAGDPEAAVIGECFTGLLAVEPDESLAFVARFLADRDDAICELAALALGESRLPGALDYLQTAWNDVLLSDAFRRALVRAAAMHRSDAAFDWLMAVVAESHARVAAVIVEVLAIYKHNAKLAQRLRETLAQRSDAALLERFAELWNAGP